MYNWAVSEVEQKPQKDDFRDDCGDIWWSGGFYCDHQPNNPTSNNVGCDNCFGLGFLHVMLQIQWWFGSQNLNHFSRFYFACFSRFFWYISVVNRHFSMDFPG